MRSSIVPSRLYYIKVFESREVHTREGSGWRRVEEESDKMLEHQINEWVDREKALIVGTGPINVQRIEPNLLTSIGPHPREEIRTVMITFAPPIAEGEFTYGERPSGTGDQPRGEDRGSPGEPVEGSKSGDSGSAAWESDANQV